MVAIPIYRGNLHTVPDVPRRWLMPNHKLSTKNFKSLLCRRKQALRLRTNPKLNPNSIQVVEPATLTEGPYSSFEQTVAEVKVEEISDDRVKEDSEKDENHGGGGQRAPDGGAGEPAEVPPKRQANDAVVGDGNPVVVEKPSDRADEKAERNQTPNVLNEREKRKRDVEEELEVLNTKKHSLVKVLKQLLNAEEELKRRNNTQQGVTATHPCVSLQLEVPNDSGGNPGGHVEEGETIDGLNHNVQSLHLLRMASASPVI